MTHFRLVFADKRRSPRKSPAQPVTDKVISQCYVPGPVALVSVIILDHEARLIYATCYHLN